eukprot:6042614-Prymnesium_polylepis.1
MQAVDSEERTQPNVVANPRQSLRSQKRRLTREKADDKAEDQLPRRAGREKDGQAHERNLAAALEDLEPIAAKLVASGQLLQHGGQLCTQSCILGATLV